MRRLPRFLVLLLALGLIASACGSGGAEADLVVGDVDDSGGASSVDPAAALSQAIDATGDVTTYAMTSAIGLDISLPSDGVRQTVPLDLDQALTTTVFEGDRQYVVTDMSDFMANLGEPGTFRMEMWIEDGRMILDTRELVDPGGDLDPFAPGVSSVDLAAIEARGGNFFALLGTGSMSLKALTEALLEVSDLEVSSDGRTFSGRVSFLAIASAQSGTDAEQMVEALAGAAGVESDELAAFILDMYAGIEADVVIQLDESFLLHEMVVDIDMTPMFEAIIDFAIQADPHMSAAELGQLQAGFKDASLRMEMGQRVILDPDPIPDAPEATEDRTDDWLDLLGLMGMLDA